MRSTTRKYQGMILSLSLYRDAHRPLVSGTSLANVVGLIKARNTRIKGIVEVL